MEVPHPKTLNFVLISATQKVPVKRKSCPAQFKNPQNAERTKYAVYK